MSICVKSGQIDKNPRIVVKFLNWLWEMSKLLTWFPVEGLCLDRFIKIESSNSLSLTSRCFMFFSFIFIEVSLLEVRLRWRMFGDQSRTCGGK